MGTLAVILTKKQLFSESVPLSERCLRGLEKLLGPDHPSTLLAMNQLAAQLTGVGQTKKAIEISRRAVAGFEKSIGLENLRTLEAMFSLAGMLVMGVNKTEIAEASQIFDKIIKTASRISPTHPIIGRVQMMKNFTNYYYEIIIS